MIKFLYWSFIFIVGGVVFIGLLTGIDWNDPADLWFGFTLIICILIAYLIKFLWRKIPN